MILSGTQNIKTSIRTLFNKWSNPKAQSVLLTGGSGFLGKIILEELVRRKKELNLKTIFLLIRPNKEFPSPNDRFLYRISTSPCFHKLPLGWENEIKVISGDLLKPNCGIVAPSLNHLTESVSHIINCAASTDFHMPLKYAVKVNTFTAINLQKTSHKFRNLKTFLQVSTAYVKPHNGPEGKPQDCLETLAPLPLSAQAIYDHINGGDSENHLWINAGHPNTYTFSKCLAEHLLYENKVSENLIIIRPSIVSACWKYPFPGWTDKVASLAKFALAIEAGKLDYLAGGEDTCLDVIPGDWVSNCIIENLLTSKRQDYFSIIHATLGFEKSPKLKSLLQSFEDHFGVEPVIFLPKNNYSSQPHSSITQLVDNKNKPCQNTQRLNSTFSYYTHNSFNFISSWEFNFHSFDIHEYKEVINKGIKENLLINPDREVTFGGLRHRASGALLNSGLVSRRNKWSIKLSAKLLNLIFKKSYERLTFDLSLLKISMDSLPKNSQLLIIPAHRSYLDFLVIPLLFFQRPDLGIKLPFIAAAEDFSRIPVLSWVIKQMQVFFVNRNITPNSAKRLKKNIHDLINKNSSILFFLEGTRSRTGRLLDPKLGLLKFIQGTNRSLPIIPISVTYDRIPEGRSFINELKGREKSNIRLLPLLKWLLSLFQNKINLGRIHISCGEPIHLKPESDLKAIGDDILSSLQKITAVSTSHLTCFAQKHSCENKTGNWLRREILKRGGNVIYGTFNQFDEKLFELENCWRFYWLHWFYSDAVRLYPENEFIHSYFKSITRRKNLNSSFNLDNDKIIKPVINSIVAPLIKDYSLRR
jgi:alcohol-forming fatty acyl-CoA reductase